jgi:ATP-dependent Zn protease
MISEAISTPEALAVARMRRPELADIVESTLRMQFKRATDILEARRDLLVSLARSLVERKTLSAEEIATAIENHDRQMGGCTSIRVASSS